ncbi:hypothetical protein ABK040_004420 [Willaertia magna]
MHKFEIAKSIVTPIRFFNREILVKRDDLLHTYFSGNKFRKLFYFLNNNNDAMNSKIKCVKSYGSIQSNAMLSIAALCLKNNYKFIYYINKPLERIEQHSIYGNLKYINQLKENGLQIEFISLQNSEYEEMKSVFYDKCIKNSTKENPTCFDWKENTLYLREGIAQPEAEYGYKILAKEIMDYFSNEDERIINIFLPSGTGTSSIYLQRNLKDNFKVFTTNCIGSEEYLKKQFLELDNNKIKNHPTIIQPKNKNQFQFGRLNIKLFNIIQQLKSETNIEFDYLYDSKGFLAIGNNLHLFEKNPLLYIHCGGIIANESMLPRYHECNKRISTSV